MQISSRVAVSTKESMSCWEGQTLRRQQSSDFSGWPESTQSVRSNEVSCLWEGFFATRENLEVPQ